MNVYPLGICPGMVLLGLGIHWFQIFWETAKVAVQVCTPTSLHSYQQWKSASLILHPLQHRLSCTGLSWLSCSFYIFPYEVDYCSFVVYENRHSSKSPLSSIWLLTASRVSHIAFNLSSTLLHFSLFFMPYIFHSQMEGLVLLSGNSQKFFFVCVYKDEYIER